MNPPGPAQPYRKGKSVGRRVLDALLWLPLVIWRAADAGRRVLLNLLLIAGVAALVAWWLGSGSSSPPIAKHSVLVLDMKGRLVEQARGRMVRRVAGIPVPSPPSTDLVLRDVLAALRAAGDDKRIAGALLLLDDFGGSGGLAALGEVADAISALRAKGKTVVAYALRYNQASYFLAAHADKVLLHPMGAVGLEGFGRKRDYYRDALERLGIQVHLMRVGSYKNAGEPFVANAPSPASLEAEAALWGDLWAGYVARIEKARKLEPGAVMRHIDALPGSLAAQGGDLAKLARADRFVDALVTPDELRATMLQIGRPDLQRKSFAQIGWREYLAQAVKPAPSQAPIALLVAEGNITDGHAGPGTIGGQSTAALIRRVREDESVQALVLRVNSPGGSALGSELIRRELELTRAAGKPVVVSMGDVAASGGYWIALAADEIIADAATITGSIGVFVLLPSFERGYERLGLKSGGVTTTWLREAYDPRRGLDPRLQAMIQSGVERIYADFIAKTAQARKRDAAQVEPHAQGRVWSGKQARAHGLVDRHGTLADALRAAAQRAKLPEAAALKPRWVEPQPSRLERWLQRFGLASSGPLGRLAAWLDAWSADDAQASIAVGAAEAAAEWASAALPADSGGGAAAQWRDDLLWLLSQLSTGPQAAVQAHCLCRAGID